MTIERKIGMGIAGQPTGPASDVAEVFSTHLYKGTGGALTVNNGIDLAGEGGMVWFKSRSVGQHHYIHDTERGIDNVLQVNSTSDQDDFSFLNLGVSSTGFSMNVGEQAYNDSSHTYAAWTFRKKEKFFDIVTYTGNYVAGREISHGLGGPVGMMIIKCLSNNEDWAVYHRGANGGVTPQNFKLILNNTSAAASGYWNNTAPTDSSFTVGQSGEVNGNNQTYVAYLFADNSAEDAEDQMIKCGGYTGTGADLSINLGWEPQFVIVKNTSAARNWRMFDSMRGVATEGISPILTPNSADAEFNTSNFIRFNSLGFELDTSAGNDVNSNNDSHIYMAIRAPMMVKPEAATDVFGISNAMTQPLPAFNSTFPVDMSLNKRPAYGQNNAIGSRLQGTKHLYTDTTGAEVNEVEYVWDYMDGWGAFNSNNSDYRSWNWKRAKGYMDVVAYTGNHTDGRTVAHNLGVAPEMIWVKLRDTYATEWMVFHKDLTTNHNLQLDSAAASGDLSGRIRTPTATTFTLGSDTSVNRQSPLKYIAYLFATLAGISKLGSYTGNGGYQTINCGFSSGARFILIKRTNVSGDWYIWDSARGIVSGNDPHSSLNTTAAQVTSDDSVDPANAGFIVNQVSATNINVSSSTYIFYAVA